MAQAFVAGWNVPGYLPDSDPCEKDSWESCRDYLVWELERWEDTDDETSAKTHAEYDAAIAVLIAAKPGEAFAYIIDDGRAGVCVWIESVDNDD